MEIEGGSWGALEGSGGFQKSRESWRASRSVVVTGIEVRLRGELVESMGLVMGMVRDVVSGSGVETFLKLSAANYLASNVFRVINPGARKN